MFKVRFSRRVNIWRLSWLPLAARGNGPKKHRKDAGSVNSVYVSRSDFIYAGRSLRLFATEIFSATQRAPKSKDNSSLSSQL
jgi:hypothetical protein